MHQHQVSYFFMIPMHSLISFLSSFPPVFFHTTFIGYFLIVLNYTLFGTFGVDFYVGDGYYIGCIGDRLHL